MGNLCPVCRHENRTENRYCTRCGAKLDETKILGPRLVILNGDKKSVVSAYKDGVSTLGRDIENYVVINDNQISKKHAVIYFDKGQYWIEDLNSKNGVFLNGKRIHGRERLFEGSLIKLGSTILRFEGSR